MNRVNPWVLYFLVLFLSCPSFAQEFDKAFFRKNLAMKQYALDTEAEALVLYEKGDVHINRNGSGHNQVFHVRRIIRIFNTSAQKTGNIREVYPNNGDNNALAKNVRGITYNLEGSKVVETPLEAKDVYDKKIDQYYHELAFAMPAVKAGSIIDYEYEIVNPLHTHMPDWEFQGKIPKLKSEYEIVSPVQYRFNVVTQGHLQFKQYGSVQEAEHDKATAYNITTPATDSRYSTRWCRNNCTALKSEPFISDVENFREYLDLQISGHNDNEIVSSWKTFDYELWNEDYFGMRIKKADIPAKVVDSLTKSEYNQAGKARSIFNYVRTNFDCRRAEDILARHELGVVFANRSGSEAEINMLLVAMLRKAGLQASPALLSTVGNRRALESYPVLGRFNYVVCAVTADGEQYFLDASNRFNTFGTLRIFCYNGYVRIIDEEGSSAMLTSKNVKSKAFFKANVSRVTDTSMNVDMMERISAVTAVELRNKLAKDSTFLKSYVNNRINELKSDATVTATTVDNLYNPDKDLTIKYSFRMRREAGDITYLKPDFVKFFEKNPFTSPERKLPVEFNNKCEYTYSMDVLLPKGLTPEDIPAPVTSKVGINGVVYDRNVAFDSSMNMLSLNVSFAVNETTYPVADYQKVRAFFESMMAGQNGVLVLKKTEGK